MKIITWNIKRDSKYSFIRWHKRGSIFKEAILAENPDIFCVQEAQKNQIDFFLEAFPFFEYIGKGRNDGKEKGDYCAIFYKSKIFTLLEWGIFWLSRTPDFPSVSWDFYPRICTWGKFRQVSPEKDFLLFNTHLPLPYNFWARRNAVIVILKKIKFFMPLPVILSGDFNCSPWSKTRKLIHQTGFLQISNQQRTTHIIGMPLFSFDAIYATKEWEISKNELLKTHRGLLYPSNHFGVKAEVGLP